MVVSYFWTQLAIGIPVDVKRDRGMLSIYTCGSTPLVVCCQELFRILVSSSRENLSVQYELWVMLVSRVDVDSRNSYTRLVGQGPTWICIFGRTKCMHGGGTEVICT